MVDFPTTIGALSSATQIIKFVEQLVNRHKGTRRTLLLELKRNVEIIAMYIRDGAPIDKVIAELKTQHLYEAIQSNFDFNSFSKAKVSDRTVEDIGFYQSYIGWSTEDLFLNIYQKIDNLQTIVRIDSDNPRVRKSVRLMNIEKMIKLLLVHISPK